MTAPNPLYTIEQFPTTSQSAIEEFDTRYLATLGAVQPPNWADDIGDSLAASSPMVTYPISTIGLKYQQTMGESRAKSAKESSLSVKVEEFDEGIEAKLMDLFTNVFAYQGWQRGPEQLLLAEKRLRNASIATLIEAGTATECWDRSYFFATDHPANIGDASKGTFSNYQASGKTVVSITNIAAEVTLMKAVLDTQGQKVGVNPDTILVPTAVAEGLKNLLAQNLILGSAGYATETNPYQGKFNVIEIPELTDANDWYLVDSKLMKQQGLPPWGIARYVPPNTLGLRRYDESSDFFKDTGKIKVSSHVWYGFALIMPHAIRKVVGA
jgi:hypothetical protein